jgi:hypothetical protein
VMLTARALLLRLLESACHRTGATAAGHLRTLSNVRMQYVYQGYLDIEFVGTLRHGVSLHTGQESINDLGKQLKGTI